MYSRHISVLDRDKDGYITVQELEQALSRTKEGFTAQEIADIMRAADTNNDGKIDYNGENTTNSPHLHRQTHTHTKTTTTKPPSLQPHPPLTSVVTLRASIRSKPR